MEKQGPGIVLPGPLTTERLVLDGGDGGTLDRLDGDLRENKRFHVLFFLIS